MFQFFRRIRQRLLSENKFSKYLIYAIGEILLVVIGILIALQINNWNQDQQAIKKGESILAEIERDLSTNINNFQDLIDQENNLITNSIDYVLECIEERRPYSDTFSIRLQPVKVIEEVEIVSTGFEAAKNIGLDIIASDSLRSEIVYIYGYRYPRIFEVLKEVGRIRSERMTP